MKTCHFEEKIDDLLAGSLEAEAAEALENHLVTCTTCFARWEEASAMVQVLSQASAPEPPPNLLADFQSELTKALASEDDKSPLWPNIQNRARSIFWPGNTTYRVLQAAALLIFGVFIGRQFLAPVPEVVGPPVPAALNQNISTEEIESVQRFFNEAEMLIIQVMNLSYPDAIETEEIEFTQSIAQDMLVRSQTMQEEALELNDMAMLKLLHRMDVLLYEVANLSGEDMPDMLPFIQKMIRDMNIVAEIRLILEETREAIKPFSI